MMLEFYFPLLRKFMKKPQGLLRPIDYTDDGLDENHRHSTDSQGIPVRRGLAGAYIPDFIVVKTTKPQRIIAIVEAKKADNRQPDQKLAEQIEKYVMTWLVPPHSTLASAIDPQKRA